MEIPYQEKIESNPFIYKGNAALIPMQSWLKVMKFYLTKDFIPQFYNQYLSKDFGELNKKTKEQQDELLEFAYMQFVNWYYIEPISKQALLLYDDVFIIAENWISKEIAVSKFSKENESLIPKISKGIGNADIITIHRHLFLGFLAKFQSQNDNKNRKLRKPGWDRNRNLLFLKESNHAINQVNFIQSFYPNSKFSILAPTVFNRIYQRKSNITKRLFNNSPSAQLLFPDLDRLPWDEVLEISKTKDYLNLKKEIVKWDNNIQNKDIDFKSFSKNIQPILDYLINQSVKEKISKKKAVVNFLIGLLPQPLGSIPGGIDLINKFRKRDTISVINRVRNKN